MRLVRVQDAVLATVPRLVTDVPAEAVVAQDGAHRVGHDAHLPGEAVSFFGL